jgi:hypothetical protein
MAVAEAIPTTRPTRSIQVIERAAWGAVLPAGRYQSHTIDRLTVHHTATVLEDNRDAPAHIRGHQRFHQQDRGWPDLAYHFVVDRAGNIYEGRPLTARGDTATGYDPTGHFLPVLEGDYDRQDPTGPQIDALVDLFAWAAAEFGADPATLAGHRDYAATSCPGEAVYQLIADGSLLEAVLASPPVALTYLRGQRAHDRVTAIESGV